MTEAELLDFQIEALYIHDAAGRITRVNEPDGNRAPRFYLGRTAFGNQWRVRDDVDDTTARELQQLAADEPVGSDLRAEPRHRGKYLDVLGIAPGREVVHAGPEFRFPDFLPEPNATLQFVRITPENGSLLIPLGWESATERPTFAQRQPVLALVQDEMAVAVCFSSRLTDRAAEAGLEVLPDYRGRGFGSAITLAWARAVREGGRIPLYSTDWNNAASLGVARRLGLIMYSSDWSIQ